MATWDKPADVQSALEEIGMTEHFKTMEVPATFTGLLDDGNWEVIFHQFTKAEFSSENVEFLRAVGMYEASPSHELGSQIYEKYVSASASSQVNLGPGSLVALNAAFGPRDAAAAPAEAEEPGADVFAAAKEEIVTVTGRDTFARFRKAAVAAQASFTASEDWGAVETRGRADGRAAPLPAGYRSAADDIPPPPPADDDDVPPPPPADAADVPPPPPPADAADVPPPPGPSAAPADAADVPPPPPADAADVPPPPPLEEDEVPPPPPASPAP